jgi:hypothetical protein
MRDLVPVHEHVRHLHDRVEAGAVGVDASAVAGELARP